jgi:hypothetical protein
MSPVVLTVTKLTAPLLSNQRPQNNVYLSSRILIKTSLPKDASSYPSTNGSQLRAIFLPGTKPGDIFNCHRWGQVGVWLLTWSVQSSGMGGYGLDQDPPQATC